VPVGCADGDLDRTKAIADLVQERQEFVEGGARAVGQLGLGLYRGVEPLQVKIPKLPRVGHPHDLAS